jgi:hypothetical protein
MTHEPKGKGNQLTTGWNYKIDFVYSDDFFKSKKIGAHKGNKFLLTKDYLFLAQVLDQDSQEVMLLSANSREPTYDFQNIELGMKKFREHSYIFLDTSENSVFLHVNHFGEKSRFGHIYISDLKGIKFSNSVNYNVRSPEGECDFGKVRLI